MSCPRTQHLLIEYFSDDLSKVTQTEIEKHLLTCDDCTAELESIQNTQSRLRQWQDDRVPHWDRGKTLFRQEHPGNEQQRRNWFWQWLPSAASFAMLCMLIFNTSISRSESGFTVSFGTADDAFDKNHLELRLAQFGELQQLEQNQMLQDFLARMDERQDGNNLRLMQAVFDQTKQTTAESFDQMYSYFEQRRQLDLENVQVSYQQLVDSDFETLMSMQQLANYVRYPGDAR